MTAPHYHSHVDDPAAVGRRLREARIEAGLSQRQLSFPGCSAAYISRLEAGDRVPSLQLLRKLAEKLDADEQYLATGEERIEQMSPESVEAEVKRRLNGDANRTPEPNRPAGSLHDPAERARVLWEHSRALALAGERSTAVHYARDALALLDYADDRRHLDA
jgi:transcriptional regulator with XRE-family HTH domain